MKVGEVLHEPACSAVSNHNSDAFDIILSRSVPWDGRWGVEGIDSHGGTPMPRRITIWKSISMFLGGTEI